MDVEDAVTGGDGTETRVRANLQSKLGQPRVRHVALHRNRLHSNSNSFSAVAECLVVVNTHQESVCSSIFGLRARDSWDYALLLLCYLGAGWPYVIVAANVPVQRGH